MYTNYPVLLTAVLCFLYASGNSVFVSTQETYQIDLNQLNLTFEEPNNVSRHVFSRDQNLINEMEFGNATQLIRTPIPTSTTSHLIEISEPIFTRENSGNTSLRSPIILNQCGGSSIGFQNREENLQSNFSEDCSIIVVTPGSSHNNETQTKSPFKKTPIFTFRKTPIKSPVKRTPIFTLRRTPVSSPKRTPISSIRITPVSPPRGTPVSPPRRTPVSPPRRTPVSPPRRTPVSPPRTPVSPPRETPISSIKITPVSPPKETPILPPRTPVPPPRRTPVPPPRRTPVPPPRRTPVPPPRRTPVPPLRETPTIITTTSTKVTHIPSIESPGPATDDSLVVEISPMESPISSLSDEPERNPQFGNCVDLECLELAGLKPKVRETVNRIENGTIYKSYFERDISKDNVTGLVDRFEFSAERSYVLEPSPTLIALRNGTLPRLNITVETPTLSEPYIPTRDIVPRIITEYENLNNETSRKNDEEYLAQVTVFLERNITKKRVETRVTRETVNSMVSNWESFLSEPRPSASSNIKRGYTFEDMCRDRMKKCAKKEKKPIFTPKVFPPVSHEIYNETSSTKIPYVIRATANTTEDAILRVKKEISDLGLQVESEKIKVLKLRGST